MEVNGIDFATILFLELGFDTIDSKAYSPSELVPGIFSAPSTIFEKGLQKRVPNLKGFSPDLDSKATQHLALMDPKLFRKSSQTLDRPKEAARGVPRVAKGT